MSKAKAKAKAKETATPEVVANVEETATPEAETNVAKKRAVCLVDNLTLGIKCGEIIELEESVIDSLVNEGKADDNEAAIAAFLVDEEEA